MPFFVTAFTSFSTIQIHMRHYLQFGRFDFQLQAQEQGRQALVMGILNITPDSFSDAGKFQHLEFALSRAEQMILRRCRHHRYRRRIEPPGRAAAAVGR